MNSYQNHIVDILSKNICLSKSQLYQKTGIENKREFLSQIEKLIAEERIRYDADFNEGIRSVLSPKVLKLTEFENRYNIHTRTFQINYVPTAVLEKELEYVNPNCGDPFEDELDFHLEIMGYKLEEKYKLFLEKENGFVLDFSKFHYELWAEYLFHKYKDDKPQSNIIYIGNDVESEIKEIATLTKKYVPDSNLLFFSDINSACTFIDKCLDNRKFISLILVKRNTDLQWEDFFQQLQILANKFTELYSEFKIPVLILEDDIKPLDSLPAVKIDEFPYYQFSMKNDEFTIGNIIHSICENS